MTIAATNSPVAAPMIKAWVVLYSIGTSPVDNTTIVYQMIAPTHADCVQNIQIAEAYDLGERLADFGAWQSP